MAKKPGNSNTGPRPARALHLPKTLKLENVKEQLKQAASDAFAAGHPAQYDQVNVVMLHFDNDDIGVDGLEDNLAATFEQEYGFEVEKVVLPGKIAPGALPPEKIVSDVITRLQKRGALGERCLIILVFSGHGEIVNDELEVGGMARRTWLVGQTLAWEAAWTALFKSPCSVLQILDCRHALEGTHPSVEMLATPSGSERTSSNLATCFTQAIDQQLQFMDAGTSFSVAELAAAMMADRGPLKLDCFPVYAPRREEPSIVLSKKAEPSAKRGRVRKTKTKNPRVVITVHTEDTLTQNDLDDLKKHLLTAIPHAIEHLDLSLEGWYSSNSGLLSLNIPAAVWTQLPDDEAYTFVSHVVSSNHLLQPPDAVSDSSAFVHTLVTRPSNVPESSTPGAASE